MFKEKKRRRRAVSLLCEASRVKKKQNGFFPIKPLHGAFNSIKGHSSVDVMPNASTMFLPKKSVFFERTRKATPLKAGENFLPFTWVSETSIMQRHKHLTE